MYHSYIVTRRPTTPPNLDQRRAQWLKGVLDICVLGALRHGEAYGYALAQRLEEAGLGPVKGGTLYPLLRRLERDGLVATTWRNSSQGPDRKYYRLTPDGLAMAEESGTAWLAFVATTGRLIDPLIPEAPE
jgi:PadR family transcriptional regulator PadR